MTGLLSHPGGGGAAGQQVRVGSVARLAPAAEVARGFKQSMAFQPYLIRTEDGQRKPAL